MQEYTLNHLLRKDPDSSPRDHLLKYTQIFMLKADVSLHCKDRNPTVEKKTSQGGLEKKKRVPALISRTLKPTFKKNNKENPAGVQCSPSKPPLQPERP